MAQDKYIVYKIIEFTTFDNELIVGNHPNIIDGKPLEMNSPQGEFNSKQDADDEVEALLISDPTGRFYSIKERRN